MVVVLYVTMPVSFTSQQDFYLMGYENVCILYVVQVRATLMKDNLVNKWIPSISN